jgi:RNA polymerase sigma factor (sigma-70 family)
MTGDAAAVFAGQRGRLFGLAYRLLGSASDAEDVLQDAFLRWNAADRDVIAEPAAWLTRTVTNLCLTELRSARQRRERYTGVWLPEPVLTGTATSAGTGLAVATGAAGDLGPLETVAQRESVSMAMLLLCEQLTAPERAVFILHEAFGYRYGEIADLIGRSEAACRQLGHRAAGRLRAESRHARFTPPDPAEAARWRQLTSQFLAAAAAGDLAGLEQLLAEDVVAWSAAGGLSRLGAQVAALDTAQGLPEGLIHPDFVLANVVATPGGMVLVDWAGTGRGPRLWSLAFLLYAEAAKDPRRSGAVLLGYREHVTLETEELDRLAAVARARPLILRAWSVGTGRMTPTQAMTATAETNALTELIATRVRTAVTGR